MTRDPTGQDLLSQEANRMYWETEASVNQIAEELGLSKGFLYGLLLPLPAGLPCPRCRREMTFPNRTARDRGFVVCPGCGFEEEELAVQAYWEDLPEGVEAPSWEEPSRDRPPGREDREGPKEPPPVIREGRRLEQGKLLAGTALLGIAAGFALATWLRKR